MKSETTAEAAPSHSPSPSSPRPRPPLSSSILFQSTNAATPITLIDIPRSLEEAQAPPGHHRPPARIISGPPPRTPFVTPEPRRRGRGHDATPASARSAGAQIAELMAAAGARGALEELGRVYAGPFCLPRVCDAVAVDADGDGDGDAGTDTARMGGQAEAASSRVRIPPGAEYLHGSIQDLRQRFIDSAPQFKLVVLDPPWPNRSVRRNRNSSKYSTASNISEMRQLLSSIPVASHLAPDGLVAVWITNKASVFDLMTCPRGVFASWGVELVTQWTWLKVTASGEAVFDIDSSWRKPWETLLIAKRVGARVPGGLELKPRVIVAVPDVHSRKPNLRRLFGHVFGGGEEQEAEEGWGLEVFARNLTAGWWSWGDQVLHFQGAEHWVDG
ncbi:MT-A70 domain-containing protein [Trichoderma novae-zelandiae]